MNTQKYIDTVLSRKPNKFYLVYSKKKLVQKNLRKPFFRVCECSPMACIKFSFCLWLSCVSQTVDSLIASSPVKNLSLGATALVIFSASVSVRGVGEAGGDNMGANIFTRLSHPFNRREFAMSWVTRPTQSKIALF